MKDFEAFKLDKKQMNAIAGGEIYCYEDKPGGQNRSITYSDGIKLEDAQQNAGLILDDPVCEEVIKV